MRLPWLIILPLVLPVDAILRTKFHHWFPQYRERWVEGIEGPCRQDAINYMNNDRTTCETPCACVADCLLQNITGTIQSNLASAQVLLGLVPVTAGLVGPTIAEVSILSTYRPLLAFLLAIGSPAINITRTFRRINVHEPFHKPTSPMSKAWSSWLASRSARVRILVKAATYAVALAAVAINIRNSIDLDMRTISGWRCGALHMPLVWSTFGAVVHFWGIVATRLRVWRRPSPSESLRSILQSQVFKSMDKARDNILSQGLFWMASFSAVVHMTFGVLVLSSLVFIGALEALQIFIVYAVSVMVCQLILLLELANMRYELDLAARSDVAPELDTLVSAG